MTSDAVDAETYCLGRTPQHIVATATFPDGGWVRLTGHMVGGPYKPYTSAWAASAKGMSMYAWVKASPLAP